MIYILFPVDLYNVQYSKDDTIFLVEDIHFFNRPKMKYNILKPIYHRATMKCYYDFLISQNINCHYIECKDDWTKIKEKNICFYNPVDRTILKKIKKYNYTIIDTPRFILQNDNINEYKGVIRQTSFYIWIRKKYNILMDGNKPYGGKMTYDKENRKKPYSGIEEDLPDEIEYNNKYIIEATNYVKNNFNQSSFTVSDVTLKFPIDRAGAFDRLHFFVKSLDKFEYQDVILTNDNSFVFHSGLSVMMNIGLLTPREVIDYVLQFTKDNLHNVEGFIRQILGWREFTRYMYEKKYKYANFFNATKKLDKSWYSGTTGIIPVDNCIKKAFKYGYLHHIERLMVISNYMVLFGISPKEMCKWFTEFSLDAYDWVMEFNIYCMASYCGKYTSKPYISSSNYILKMSTYKKDKWCITNR